MLEKNPLRAPSGDIAPTGRAVSVPFVKVCGVAEDQVTGFVLYFDPVELLTQLGLVAAPVSVPTAREPSPSGLPRLCQQPSRSTRRHRGAHAAPSGLPRLARQPSRSARSVSARGTPGTEPGQRDHERHASHEAPPT